MVKKLGMVDLISAIQKKVEGNTGLRCYDAVPQNAPSPFYFAQVLSITPANTKTMFCEVFTVVIHAIAAPGDSSVQIYQLIRGLEESLTEDIELPEGYELVLQSSNGMQNLKTDETREKHATLLYQFKVSYGYKTKI